MRWSWPKGKRLSKEHKAAISRGAKSTSSNSGRFKRVKTHCKFGHVLDRTHIKYLTHRQCGDCYDQKHRSGISFKRRSQSYSAEECLFIHYQRNAQKKELVWDLTIEQFKSLIFSPCHYTGRSPSRKKTARGRTILYNGIDRLDNKTGYIWSNCVPCCTEINMMKKNLGYEEFISLCKEVSFPKVDNGRQNFVAFCGCGKTDCERCNLLVIDPSISID